jgi:hypothetical protein
MTTVLLTGSRAPATLDLARRFAESGATVIVADSQPTISSSSNAVTKAYRVPSPRFDPVQFVDAVAGIVARHGVDLVVPTCEETFWLASGVAARPNRAGWGRLAEVLFAPPIGVLRRLHDKAEFVDLLGELGIPHPLTEVIDSRIAWRRRARRALPSTPRLVLKPAFSRFGTRTRVIEPGEALPDPGRVTPVERWLLQQHVDGQEFCTYAVAVQGRLTAFVAYRPVWRAGRGGTTGAGVAFEQLEPSRSEVVRACAIAARLAAALRLTGQFGLDLIHRPCTPSEPVVVLECNPRATSGIHLFTAADALPAAFALPQPDDLATGDALAAGENLAATASSPHARLALPHVLYAFPGMTGPEAVRRFLGQLRAPDALRPPGDRLPIASLLRSLRVQAAGARTTRSDLLSASTHDLEWNGEPFPGDADALADRPEDWALRFVEAVEEAGGPTSAVTNVDADLSTIAVGHRMLPLTVSRHPEAGRGTRERGDPRSYVVSPYSHYVRYAREELDELPSAAGRGASVVLGALGAALRTARVDDVVMPGNALVSTNLLPELEGDAVREVTAGLIAAHPDSAVAWRSVHTRATRTADVLRANGYRLLPSRSVLFLPTRATEWLSLRDVRRDRELFERSPYRSEPAPIDPATGMSDQPTRERIAELYRLLYLDKYSRLNPAYTAAFVGAAQQSGLLRFTLLTVEPSHDPAGSAEHQDGPRRIDGVFGSTIAHGLLAAPVFGYDTALPAETGLYRMLSWLVAREAHDAGVDLHASSGVADFKRHRGGEAELEYTAVYVRHLPWPRRLVWAGLERVLHLVALPLVRRQGL